MTTTYAVLLPSGEDEWRDASRQERAETYARHDRFMAALTERGHQITGGAELAHSSIARTVRSAGDRIEVTDGPFAESVEHLTGFYLVATDDLDDLCEACGILATTGPVEIRPCVPATPATPHESEQPR